MRYVKKPIVVDAIPLNEITKYVIIDWIREHGGEVKAELDKRFKPELHITTLEGVMIASDGDYIIKGIKGEFYPCKPDIFFKTYDKVSD